MASPNAKPAVHPASKRCAVRFSLTPVFGLRASARSISCMQRHVNFNHGLNTRLVVTTELVLAETLNAYSAHGPFVRGLAVRLVDALATDPKVKSSAKRQPSSPPP